MTYEEIDWSKIIRIDPNSVSGATWLIDVGRNGRIKAGSRVGAISYNKGTPNCWRLNYRKKSYQLHRIIWLIHYGEIDNTKVINHIDCNPLNNKIENLELCTDEENNRRMKMHVKSELNKLNTSGRNGVCIWKRDGYKYAVAVWKENGKNKYKYFSAKPMGIFDAIEKADEFRKGKLKWLQ